MTTPLNTNDVRWSLTADNLSSSANENLVISANNKIVLVGDLSNNCAISIGSVDSSANCNVNAFGQYMSNNVNAMQLPIGSSNDLYTPLPGYIRFNGDTSFMEYFNGNWVAMAFPPYYTAISPAYINQSGASPITYTITGKNFDSTSYVTFIGNKTRDNFASPTTTYISSTQITALQNNSMSDASSNTIYYVNIRNLSNGLSYVSSNVYLTYNYGPTWSYTGALPNTATSLETYTALAPIASLLATDPNVPITYYYQTPPSGAATGLVLLSTSTGAIYGTMPGVVNATSFGFTAYARDSNGSQGTIASFILQVVPAGFTVTGYTLGTDYAISYVDSSNNVIASPTTTSYTVYKFNTANVSAGKVVPNFNGSVLCLVVAGGGGGGNNTYSGSNNDFGGGGGAGGYISTTLSVARGTEYSLIVGSGGAAGSAGGRAGTNGSNSVFGSITSTGGGGGSGGANAAKSGGSGGGANSLSTTAGLAIGTQGHAGGKYSTFGGMYYGGPGGGASGVGSNTSYTGGQGAVTNIAGTNVTYATGGYGYYTGPGPVNNSGNGGNGGQYYTNKYGTSGSSGTVILRFPSLMSYVQTLNGGTVTGFVPGQYTVSYVTSANIVSAYPVSGGYTIYTFLSTAINGTFTPNFTASADFLVIGGGGSGGTVTSANAGYMASGGGAGGYRTSFSTSGGGSAAESSLSLTSGTPYTVVVGLGGVASQTTQVVGGSGGVSQFGSITSVGGGGGGAGGTGNGGNGGSGGGANASAASVGQATATQGTDGFQNVALCYGGGAGGGASTTGRVNPTQPDLYGCIGGDGLASTITGTSIFRGGGGGGGSYSNDYSVFISGGAGGTGGGGTGGTALYSVTYAGNPGTPNTGGGGGGGTFGISAPSGSIGVGGDGGSGVVIIRFPSF